MAVPLRYNLRNLAERKATTLMTAMGIGLTVAVLITAIALTSGLASVFAGSGHPLQALVLRKGTDAELNSTVTEESVQIIKQLPGITRMGAGASMASPEVVTVVNLPSVEAPDGMNVTVRGMLAVGREMREEAAIISGRWNEPGKREIVVGESISSRYPAARVGQEVRFGRGMWTVVGVFKMGESAANSEIWADLNQLRGDFEDRGGANAVLVRMESAAALDGFKAVVEGDQRLGSSAVKEKEYYANMTKSGAFLQFIGFFVSIVMAVGSGFAATNTMYAAVARRSREIGTLRALGFSRGAIMRSFVFESVCLALIGGVLGCLIAFPLNNFSAGVGNFQTFSETAFRFKVTPMAMGLGLLFAAVIGAVGGFLPAFSASRKNPIQAMREG